MLTIIAVTLNFAALFFASVGGYGVAVDERDKTSYILLLIAIGLTVIAMGILKY